MQPTSSLSRYIHHTSAVSVAPAASAGQETPTGREFRVQHSSCLMGISFQLVGVFNKLLIDCHSGQSRKTQREGEGRRRFEPVTWWVVKTEPTVTAGGWSSLPNIRLLKKYDNNQIFKVPPLPPPSLFSDDLSVVLVQL